MHELAITESVVQAVTERLPGSAISCVHLEIGPMSGVVPDSVRFCFGLVTEGTSLQGARLEISQPTARCRCRDCDSEFQTDGMLPLCGCGSADVEILAGNELRIRSVEVAKVA
jgi:hydrogenase nickel incorporation protein HypA/HybF